VQRALAAAREGERMSGTGDPAPAPDAPTPPARGWRRWRRDVALVVVTAAVILGLQAFLFRDDDGGDEDAATETTVGSSTTSDPSATTATTTDPSETGNFEDGIWAVGSQIEPGRYIVTGFPEGGCSWARLADVEGDDVIVADEAAVNQVIVDILASDAAFRSQGCGVWEVYAPRDTPPQTTIEDGDWVVGDQIEPGSYQSQSGSSCGWTRARGFEHTAQEVIDSVPAELRPPTVLTVELADGERFSSKGCQTWVRAG